MCIPGHTHSLKCLWLTSFQQNVNYYHFNVQVVSFITPLVKTTLRAIYILSIAFAE
jgi:hypothetical protein